MIKMSENQFRKKCEDLRNLCLECGFTPNIENLDEGPYLYCEYCLFFDRLQHVVIRSPIYLRSQRACEDNIIQLQFYSGGRLTQPIQRFTNLRDLKNYLLEEH